MIWEKPPDTIANRYPSRRSVRTSVRAPGASTMASYTSSSACAGTPARSATRDRSDSSKSISPRIAASVTARDLGLAPGMGGQHLDHLALDEGGVHVHHDQADAAAQQVGGLHGDVDALAGGLRGEHGAQRARCRCH